MLQLLMSERVLTADSQFNNNRLLRALVDQREELDFGRPIPRDFALLLGQGYFVPLVRADLGSLAAVRAEHVGRRVEDTPSPEYVAFVEERLGGNWPTYDPRAVSQLFKSRVLGQFGSSLSRGSGRLRNEVASSVLRYVEGQDTLLYDSLRKWMRKDLAAGRLSNRDYTLIDNMVADCYRLNVPISLACRLDVPVAGRVLNLPLDLQLGNSATLRSLTGQGASQTVSLPATYVLSRDFLAAMPASALLEIKGSPSANIAPLDEYRKMLELIRKYERTGDIELESFADQLERYLEQVKRIGLAHMDGGTASSFLTSHVTWQQTSVMRYVDAIANIVAIFVGFVEPWAGVVMALAFAASALRRDPNGDAASECFDLGVHAGQSLGKRAQLLIGKVERSGVDPGP
jgi:hypothetical protein